MPFTSFEERCISCGLWFYDREELERHQTVEHAALERKDDRDNDEEDDDLKFQDLSPSDPNLDVMFPYR